MYEVNGVGYKSKAEYDEMLGHLGKNYPKDSSEETVTEFLRAELMCIADEKHEGAYHLFLGYKSTPMQIERYKDKYERARLGEFDTTLNKVIIAKYEAMIAAIRGFTDLIEMFREFTSDLIEEGELERAQKAIDAAEGFGATTQADDVKALMAGLME